MTSGTGDVLPRWTSLSNDARSNKKKRSRFVAIFLLFSIAFAFTSYGRKISELSFLVKSAVVSRQCSETDYVCKVKEARHLFHQITASQSKTCEHARQEYERRYNRKPPTGFDEWFTYAAKHDYAFIDEFDQLEADLMPFRQANITRARFESRMATMKSDAKRFDHDYKWLSLPGTLKIKNGTITVTGNSRWNINLQTVEELVAPIAHHLPNLELLINWNAGPRILGSLSSEDTKSDNVTLQDTSNECSTADKFLFNKLQESCPQNYIANSSFAYLRPSIDICGDEAKATIQHKHGFVTRPHYAYLTDTLVPILSRAKISTMRDILTPNPCYAHDSYRNFGRTDNIPFEKKKRSIFWRGSTTGGLLTDLTLMTAQRPRFIYLMQKIKTYTETRTWPNQNDISNRFDHFNVVPHYTKQDLTQMRTFAPSMFDVNYTTIYDIDSSFRPKFDAIFPLVPKVDAMEQFENQIVADIDGEGMSCRFYRQLQSNSVPLKQTVFAEWHDDRIIPWYHYIPLSMGMNELPQVIHWLFETQDGQRLGKEIAMAGKALADQSLRKVDLTIFFYRVLLEFASISYS